MPLGDGVIHGYRMGLSSKGITMKRFMIAAAGAALFATAPAQAAVVVNFTPAGTPPSPGYSIINTFDNLSGVTVNAGQVKILTGNSGQGAQPAFGSDGSYLSVLGGGSATINFASSVSGFQFAWGSLDAYNKLTVTDTANNSYVYIPGGFTSGSNGNQVNAGTNGLFQATGTDGTRFTSIKLESTGNSFEIDNLAAAVPEPSTWALMIVGFGMVGGAMRRRTAMFTTATA